MIKQLVYSIYYKTYLEKRLKKVIFYLLLNSDEIKKIADELNVFSVVSIAREGFYYLDDGLFYINLDIGTLKNEYVSMSKTKLKKELILRFKKVFLDLKGIYIPVEIHSLTDDKLVFCYPISEYGKQNFNQIVKMKTYSSKQIALEKSHVQEKLNNALSKQR